MKPVNEPYRDTVNADWNLSPKACKPEVLLALAELDLLELDGFSFSADNSLGASVALANALFEVLAALDDRDRAGLLDFAVETAK